MEMISRSLCSLAVLVLVGNGTCADDQKDPWASFQFLIGDWVGEGSGQPGQGEGRFSLKPDLEGKILVRRNHASYPAQGGRPPVSHDDLMVIYPGEKESARAIYFDNEGHVIHYTVTSGGRILITPTRNVAGLITPGLVFLSESQPSGPRFRLSYTQEKAGLVSIKFEIAPPGKPDEFKTYLEGKVRRKEPLAK
jgi:hypothetical protein